MSRLRPYRGELIALLIVAATVLGALEGFHVGRIDLVAVAGVSFAAMVVAMGTLRALAVAESVFLLEAVSVSVLLPPLIEPSVQFELIGVWLALAFGVGILLHRSVDDGATGPRFRR